MPVIVPQPPEKGDARFDQWVYLLWKSLRGVPEQFNPIAGANVTLTGTYPDITFAASGGNAGTVNFAAGATTLVVTNTLVTVNSIVVATVAANDATMKSVQAVAAAGSFTLYANAAATAETRVNFLVIN